MLWYLLLVHSLFCVAISPQHDFYKAAILVGEMRAIFRDMTRFERLYEA
jgi:hypothetical protein